MYNNNTSKKNIKNLKFMKKVLVKVNKIIYNEIVLGKRKEMGL